MLIYENFYSTLSVKFNDYKNNEEINLTMKPQWSLYIKESIILLQWSLNRPSNLHFIINIYQYMSGQQHSLVDGRIIALTSELKYYRIRSYARTVEKPSYHTSSDQCKTKIDTSYYLELKYAFFYTKSYAVESGNLSL